MVSLFSRLKVSLIIPVYNGGESFCRCLESIAASRQQPDEIIVVADGDTDGSWEVAERFGAHVIRVAQSEGPAAARNRGAQVARGDILFFVDADVTLHATTLERMMAVFEQDSSVDALIGSYDDAPGAGNFLSQYRNLLHHYTHQISSGEASTFWGACGAIRRPAFLSVGGFDARYRKPCIEDIELGYRLKRSGYRIRLCKTVQVKHLKCWRPVQMVQTDIFCRALPWTELLLRDRQPMNDLNLQANNRLSVICAFASVVAIATPLVYPWALGGALAVVMLALAVLFGLNLGIYRFFYRRRGVLFTLQAMIWHWFFYVYSGAAYALGTARHHLGASQIPAPLSSPLPLASRVLTSTLPAPALTYLR
jgi:glycosyltransferase involved in cell wall biosynthesis